MKEKEEKYRDKDIKLNWKTLMHFSKNTWKSNKQLPLNKELIDAEKLDQFFIGRSDIDEKKIYFIVSTNIIPTDQPSYIFQDSFFATMVYNTEYEIPQYSIEKLHEAVRDAGNYIITHIQPAMIDGIKMWKGKYKNGSHTPPQSIDWISSSFLPQFQPYYNRLMNDSNIGKHLKIPSGKTRMEFNDKTNENDNDMSLFATNIDVGFCFDSDAFCAFGNMANAMHIMGDDKAARFFFSHASA